MNSKREKGSTLSNRSGVAVAEVPPCTKSPWQNGLPEDEEVTIVPNRSGAFYDENWGFGPSSVAEEEAFDAGFGRLYLTVDTATTPMADVLEVLATFMRTVPAYPQSPFGIMVDLCSDYEVPQLEQFATANPGLRIYSVDYNPDQMFRAAPRPNAEELPFPTPVATARRALQRAVAACDLAEQATFALEESPIGDLIAAARRQVTKALEALVAASPKDAA
jgi:hypothetical protein